MLVENFAKKTVKNPRFGHWFPAAQNTGHNTRTNKTYLEERARTERYYNSPVFYMRQCLNALDNAKK